MSNREGDSCEFDSQLRELYIFINCTTLAGKVQRLVKSGCHFKLNRGKFLQRRV